MSLTISNIIQFEVLSAHVDDFDSEIPPSDVPRGSVLDYGYPVMISRGKHAGKTGRVGVLERDYVRVVEDATEIEVRKCHLSLG